jgi:hypothetical protein
MLLTGSLALPSAAADYSIANGTAIIHTDGDPGVSISPQGGAQARLAWCLQPPGCAGVAGYGHTSDQDYIIIATAGICTEEPCAGALLLLYYEPTLIFYVFWMNEEQAEICELAMDECYRAGWAASTDPAAPGACLEYETGRGSGRLDGICDGLFISTDPLCIERQSDGFDIVCEA